MPHSIRERKKLRRCCQPPSSSESDHGVDYYTRRRLPTDNETHVRLPNTKVHPLPPDLGPDPVIINVDRLKPAPKQSMNNPKNEAAYQKAMKKSWERTHRLLGMNPKTPPPVTSKQKPDHDYADYVLFGRVQALRHVRFVFVDPEQDPAEFARMFVYINSPVLDIIDDTGIRLMYAAETLGMVRKTLPPKKFLCWHWRFHSKRELRRFDRTTQPWEVTFISPDGGGIMHASRGTRHDVTVTNLDRDLCYIVRTDTGRFPRHYNVVDARSMTKLCELTVPLPPEDEVLGNFDVLLENFKIAKIRQGGWSQAHRYDRNVYRTRFGIHVHPDIDPELKAFLVVALLNAVCQDLLKIPLFMISMYSVDCFSCFKHFTFCVSRMPGEKHHDALKKCNPEIWKSVHPDPDLDSPTAYDQFWLDHALRFYHPWYRTPAGVQRLSSGSIDIDPALFLTKYLEETSGFTYPRVPASKIASLPFQKPMPAEERMRRNLYINVPNSVPLLVQGYDEDTKKPKKSVKKSKQSVKKVVAPVEVPQAQPTTEEESVEE